MKDILTHEEFRDRNEHVYLAVEEESMNKTEFEQASIMRNCGRNSFKVLIPRETGFPLKTWSVFMFIDSVALINQDIYLFALAVSSQTWSQFCYLYPASVHYSLIY